MASSKSMTGKVCMITGSNTGIGKVTAGELAKMGATIVMVCRESVPGEPPPQTTQSELQKISQNDNIDILFADLSSQQSIRQLVEDFQKKYDKLHVLINNAGALIQKRTLTPDGLETQFAVNLLAPFLLTNLLLDRLKASAPSRVVNIASTMHRFAKLDFDNLQGEKRYKSQPAYNQAKLGVILFTFELARRLEGTGVIANCLHPGVVGTGIMREWPAFAQFFWNMMTLSPEKGAATSIYLASSPKVEGVSGRYFDKCKEAKSSGKTHDTQLAGRLWNDCAQLSGLA